MISILHVTPHLGGGVGRVLLNYLSHTFNSDQERQSLLCLDYANPAATEWATDIGIPLEDQMSEKMPSLLNQMAQADIVVMHWWNHPLLFSLMVREALPPTRLLLWSHVSGLYPTQNFTDELIGYPDLFVIASPVSFDTPAIKRLNPAERQNRVRLVFSCAGIEHVASAKPVAHEGFRVGYVGTVDYCKMHPHFIQMSTAANIPGAQFVVCGGPSETVVRQDAINANMGDRFNFLGPVSDVASQLSSFDLFGYPLAKYHYGTGEQALIEALAVGIPPVVLGNGAEQHVVQDGTTGIVAENERAYSQALEQLYRHPDLRQRLSNNARRIAREKFSIENLASSWSALFQETMQTEKRLRRWPGFSGAKSTDAELFLAALGGYGGDYAKSMTPETNASVSEADEQIATGNQLFRSKTRGSVFHYQSFFPHNSWINFWCGLIAFDEGKDEESRQYFMTASNNISRNRMTRYLEKLSGRA